MTNAADMVIIRLKAEGVRWISTLCGNGLDPLFQACCREGIRVVDTHNEQAAAYMADANARFTGRLSVCAVSSGIAHCNALTGLANAYFDGAPLLLITGASAGYGMGRGAFQEFDQVALAEPICKLSKAVQSAAELEEVLGEAISAAMTPRRGPVHLTIPRDVLETEVDLKKPEPFRAKPTDAVAPSLIREVTREIQEAERPVLVAGTGLFMSGGQRALLEFSEKMGVPVVVPIWDRGCVETPHPNFMGVVGAASGQPRVLEDADLVILAGAAADYRVGYISPPTITESARIARIDDDPGLVGEVTVDFKLLGNPSDILGRLTAEADHGKWIQICRSRVEEFRRPWTSKVTTGEQMTGRDIVEAIRPLLSEELILLIDGGNIGQWAHMALADHYPGRWITCGASAVVGWGIPGAMAARLAEPDRPILLLSGDGAFGFTVTELESAARQDLPFVAVVANDSAWGIVVCGQRESWGSTVACETCEIQFDRIAEAMGARGVRAVDPSGIGRAIERGFSERVPTVIDVPIRVHSPTDAKS